MAVVAIADHLKLTRAVKRAPQPYFIRYEGEEIIGLTILHASKR